MSWWLEIEEAEPDETREKAEKLANVLGRLPGTRAQKIEFLERNLALMEAEAEREGIPAGDTRRFGGMMKSLAIRWWRNEWKRLPAVARAEGLEIERPKDRPMTEEEKARVRDDIAAFRARKRAASR